MCLAALGVLGFMGYQGWVISTAQPIVEPRADSTSQAVDGREAESPPFSRPDSLPADTESQSIDTTGSSD